MPLSGLLVLHRRKSAQGALARPRMPPSLGDRPVFHLETCLRELWVLDTGRTPNRVDVFEGLERHHGYRAYEFLLRVGCGLDSELKGESDVFGQLRDAWRAFEGDHPVQASDLGPLMQRIFEDVKEIRSRHLRNLGSITYGGLARRLLGEDVGAPTLLVGAGRMAQAVIPYLCAQPLYVWNRSSDRTSQLLATLPAERAASIRVLPAGAGAEIDAWRRVTNVVLCVPANPRADAARLEAWAGCERLSGRIIHLGLLGAAGSAFEDVPGVATLEDLFALQASHNALRDAQLARATAACREKARLRSLGGPLSLAHGWEDLCLFAGTG